MKRKLLLTGVAVLTFGLGASAIAEDLLPPPPPPPDLETPAPPPGRNRERGDRSRDPDADRRGAGPAMWRAFSRLTEEERQSLLTLQSSDPEQFRTKMRELGEALHKEERARFAELMKLVERYRASGDEKEKVALQEQVTASVRLHYLERLEDNKRQLEEMKQRALRLEEELRKREANADAVVKARAEALLRGEHPELPPKPKK